MNRSLDVFISVAEPSADEHAAALLRTARSMLPGCRFHGFAGPKMVAAGCEAIGDLTAHAAMLAGVLKLIGRGWMALRAARRSWQARRPDLVLVMDSGALHLRMAAAAKQAGRPVLYYIAPQTWASREYRVRRLARDVDRLACILPFEEAYFRRHGVNATFVGHPLFDGRAAPAVSANPAADRDPAARLAILPGSRKGVVAAVLPKQLAVLRGLRSRGRTVTARISAASDERREQIATLLSRFGMTDVPIVPAAENPALLAEADLVLVASGTATLAVAAARRPMVVLYEAGALLRWPYELIGRRFLLTPHLSLVNILAGERIVPEFMPYVGPVERVVDAAETLLDDSDARSRQIARLDAVVRPLEQSQASANVCRMIAELTGGTAAEDVVG